MLLLSFLYCGETFATIYRAIVFGQERYLSFLTTFGANHIVHFTPGIACALVVLAACFATQRLILKAFFLIEFLLACGEHKFLSTVLANKRLVLIHGLH